MVKKLIPLSLVLFLVVPFPLFAWDPPPPPPDPIINSFGITPVGPNAECTAYIYDISIEAMNLYWSSGFIWGRDDLMVWIDPPVYWITQTIVYDNIWIRSPGMDGHYSDSRLYEAHVSPAATANIRAEVW